MYFRCGYLRDSCLCTRISGVEGVLLDWVRLSFRWESCTGRAACAKQASNGGSNSLLAGLLNTQKQQHKVMFCFVSQELLHVNVQHKSITLRKRDTHYRRMEFL